MMKHILFSFFLIFMLGLSLQAQEDLKVMTYNIRYNNPGDGENAWPNRKDGLINYLNEHSPDLICIQEALPEQMEALEAGLPGYAWIGRSREKNKKKGEFAAIFYKTGRVSMRLEGNFWLSNEPDKAGSVGWDAELPRMVTWGFFRDEATGKSFYLFNTHFSHKGNKARQQSSKMICSKAKKIGGRYPSIIAGDLNMEPDDENMNLFEVAGYLDTRNTEGIEPQGPEATCFGFSTDVEAGKRIDYILTRNQVTVKSHTTLDGSANGAYYSDHLPVMVGVEIGNK